MIFIYRTQAQETMRGGKPCKPYMVHKAWMSHINPDHKSQDTRIPPHSGLAVCLGSHHDSTWITGRILESKQVLEAGGAQVSVLS